MLRVKRNCSDDNNFQIELKNIPDWFVRWRYPQRVLDKASRRASNSPREALLNYQKKQPSSQQFQWNTCTFWHAFSRITIKTWPIHQPHSEGSLDTDKTAPLLNEMQEMEEHILGSLQKMPNLLGMPPTTTPATGQNTTSQSQDQYPTTTENLDYYHFSMAQPIGMNNNLPDLGAPILYWNGNENEKTSYCVETAYGFQLDLDFLKYVDDIQSGQTLRKLSQSRKPRAPRRSTSSLRSFSSQTGTWVSTESLDFSEDGSTSDSVFDAKDSIAQGYSAAKQTLGLRRSNPISPTPLFKLLPPPPARSRADKTLAETKKRLEQEQLNIGFDKIRSSNLSKLSVASRSSPNLLQGTLTAVQSNKSGDKNPMLSPPPVLSPNAIGSMKISPVNSGRNTPASNVSSINLQGIREQMAASLKRLKYLEEQVKIIPVLQKQIDSLEKEKQQLTAELDTQKTSVSNIPSINNSGIYEADLTKIHDSLSEIAISKPSKIAELKKLTEKLSDSERKATYENRTTDKAVFRYPPVKEKSKKSVAVGENLSISDVVFYYRSQQERKDAAIQYSTKTNDAGVWVIESFLGLPCEAEKEIQLLEHTIEHQRTVIKMLENHLKAASDEMEELRIAVATRTVINEQYTLAGTSADTDILMCSKSPAEYLQMVDTRAVCNSELFSSNIVNVTEAYDVASSNLTEEFKDLRTQVYTEKQLTSDSILFDPVRVPFFSHECIALGRDEVDDTISKDASKFDLTEEHIIEDDKGVLRLSAEDKGKQLANLHNSEEEVDIEDVAESRTLRTLDEVMMSCAQVLYS
ncbi:KN motif and ankyrin repeat domains 1-like [Gastrophryne carolinensis]